MWSKLIITIQRIYGDVPAMDPVDNIVSRATTPDQMIAAGIIQSFAKEFDDWNDMHFTSADHAKSVNDGKAILYNRKKDIQLKRVIKRDYNIDCYHSHNYKAYKFADGVYVNGVLLDRESSKLVIEQWERISAQVAEAKKVAAAAKKAMEENEKKWNIAESLLGMKRNEHGALVPIVTIEEK